MPERFEPPSPESREDRDARIMAAMRKGHTIGGMTAEERAELQRRIDEEDLL